MTSCQCGLAGVTGVRGSARDLTRTLPTRRDLRLGRAFGQDPLKTQALGGPKQTNPDALWLYQALKEKRRGWVGKKRTRKPRETSRGG